MQEKAPLVLLLLQWPFTYAAVTIPAAPIVPEKGQAMKQQTAKESDLGVRLFMIGVTVFTFACLCLFGQARWGSL